MKILLIGAKGQLGNEIMKLGAGSEHDFVYADINGDGTDVLCLDISDEAQVSSMITPEFDVVINCAAYNEVDKAEEDSKTALQINFYAPGYLADACKRADALLIHFSTDYVFDGKANVPYVEDDVLAPVNTYGCTKLSGEKAIQASGCRYMIFRTSWLYSLTGRNFFKTIAEKCADVPTLKVVIDQTGTPTYAYDLASLIMHIIDEDMLDRTGIYHYSDEGVASWYDFAKEINDSLGYTCRVEPCRTCEFPRPAARPAYSVLDKSKVKNTFAVEIPHWRESLHMLIREYENK